VGKRIIDIIMSHDYRGELKRLIYDFLIGQNEDLYNKPIETAACHRDGHEFPAELSVSTARSGDGHIFVIIIRDITERRNLQKSLLGIEEGERRRIGHDLHDDLGQLLTGIAFKSRWLENRSQKKILITASDIAEITFLVDRAKEQVKRLSRGLSPIVEKGEEGLMVAMKELVTNTEKIFNIPCVLKCGDPVLIQNETAVTHLYRIAQEAVTNSVKHAKPDNIEICLDKERDKITMTIRDDGTGIPEIAYRKNGMGLQIMNYRANMIGASIDVSPDSNEGTVVTCIFSDTRESEVKCFDIIRRSDNSLLYA
jgi:signal transduction histidine kinase